MHISAFVLMVATAAASYDIYRAKDPREI